MYDRNPFPITDNDRYYLWEMLVRRDIDAFLTADWPAIAGDFYEESFVGINGAHSTNPDSWKMSFPNLKSFRDRWISDARAFSEHEYDEDPRKAIFEATNMRDIDVYDDAALIHRKLDGSIRRKDGTVATLNWQNLYHCRKIENHWRIVGFTGYLPFPMGGHSQPNLPSKVVPEGASQHTTAGPYSPVLQVNPGKIVVISGQVAVDPQGKTVGQSIEEQTAQTIRNCEAQLKTGNSSLKDVFKVNVFLTDLDMWPRFNDVYREMMPAPLPVRTAVQTPLLNDFIVEIEMWAMVK